MADENPHGHNDALPDLVKPNATWECRGCGYKPLDKDTEYCVNCGRDWWGAPGRVPEDKPYRPGIHADATNYEY